MKTILRILSLIVLVTLAGCKSDDPVEPVAVKQVTLVYAVNDNNLSYNLGSNERQMLAALQTMPTDEYVVMVYKTIDSNTAGLYMAKSGVATTAFELVKQYDRNTLSTDPIRINQVVKDVVSTVNCDNRNLFLWGHGTAWTPSFSEHKASTESFGGDKNSKDWTDITELSEAIPDGMFNLIWFDACYMSNIETIYQLRNKCRYYVAYPTEIMSAGLPYDEVLPKIMSDEPNLGDAALALYDYYNVQNSPVTVTVVDMNYIDALASATRAIYMSGNDLPYETGLQNYSRSKKNPYYDFSQYTREYADLSGAVELREQFKDVLGNFVYDTQCSRLDFNSKLIDNENYCGVSVHYLGGGTTEQEEYYKTLDWYKAVYE